MSKGTRRTCVDLFSGTGGFSAAFKDSDRWETFRVDNDPKYEPDMVADVLELRPEDLPNAQVVLIGQPCDLFSNAGNHDQWDHQNKKPTGEKARKHVHMVYHAIGLAKSLSPRYWFLENPRGRLRWILGKPEGTVTYCQYGRDYQKPTDLWGEHPEGFPYKSCPAGAECHKRNRADDGTSAVGSMSSDYDERIRVPYELSESIRKWCENVTLEDYANV